MQVADAARLRTQPSGARLRVSGAVLGAGMSGAVGVLGWALGIAYVAIVGGIGVVVGAILGALFAPRALASDKPVSFALVLSVVAVPVGGAVVGVIFAFGIAVSQGTAESLPIVFATTLFSLPMYPVFAPVVVPISIASVLAGRRLARVEPRMAALALAGLAVADVAFLVLTPTIAPWLDQAVSWVADFGR
jgi:hypothetical protein